MTKTKITDKRFNALKEVYQKLNSDRFTKEEQKKRDAEARKQRQKMLTDLTTNYKLTGLKYSQLIDLLGIPDSKDSSSLSYKIIVDYGNDIDPVYAKNLDFTFSKDSVITIIQH